MSEEYLLGATSDKTRNYEREVTEPIENLRSRSNDPNLSEEKRSKSKALFEKWSQPHIIEILQCRHFTSNIWHDNFRLWRHGPNCFSMEKSLIETYEDVPRGPQGFSLPTDDNLILHMISFLDYYTAHKMTLVSKRFKGIMTTFKSIRSKEMLSSMPFILDSAKNKYFKHRFELPELTFTKSWHPKYEDEHRDTLCDDAMGYVNEEGFFEDYDAPNTPQERRSVVLRARYARECMDIYSSFPLSAIEKMIMENEVDRNGYITLDKPEDTELSTYIRFKILSRHQVTLQEAWKIFVERIIVDSDEHKCSERDVSRRYLLWSLLAAADPSSIHLSHVHVGCDNGSSISVYDHIALSFVVNDERVEVVGKNDQSGHYR